VFAYTVSITLHGLVLLALTAQERGSPLFPWRIAQFSPPPPEEKEDFPGITVVPRPIELPPPKPIDKPIDKPVEKSVAQAEPKPQGPRPQSPEVGAPNVGRVQDGLKKEGPVKPPAKKEEARAAAPPKAAPQRYQETPPPTPTPTQQTARAETESKPQPEAKPPAAKKQSAKQDPPPNGKGPGKDRAAPAPAAPLGDQVAGADDSRAKRATPATPAPSKAQRSSSAGSARIGNDATDGEVLPTFVPASYSRAELQDIVRFFQMKIIAYDPGRERKFFVEVDPDGNTMKRRVDFETFAKTMGNRGLLVNRVLPDVVQRLVKEQDLPAESVVLNAMFSAGAARYLADKETQACKAAGLEPKQVTTCHGAFRKAASGSWVIVIDRLELVDGREMAVKDAELAQLQ
jgi:hypothetical protein